MPPSKTLNTIHDALSSYLTTSAVEGAVLNNLRIGRLWINLIPDKSDCVHNLYFRVPFNLH
jgi:hypothetical protein